MRVGLDLRSLSGDELIDRASEADRLGLWAILVESTLAAAEVATQTEHVHLAVSIDADAAHPLTIAEEIAVLDHLSRRRALAIVDDPAEKADHIRQLLAGHIVDQVALAPPPAQTAVPVWHAAEVPIIELTGDLAADRVSIDDLRDDGHTHVFVQWPGSTRMLARHLASRALTPDFPQIVADHADIIAP